MVVVYPSYFTADFRKFLIFVTGCPSLPAAAIGTMKITVCYECHEIRESKVGKIDRMTTTKYINIVIRERERERVSC